MISLQDEKYKTLVSQCGMKCIVELLLIFSFRFELIFNTKINNKEREIFSINYAHLHTQECLHVSKLVIVSSPEKFTETDFLTCKWAPAFLVTSD